MAESCIFLTRMLLDFGPVCRPRFFCVKTKYFSLFCVRATILFRISVIFLQKPCAKRTHGFENIAFCYTKWKFEKAALDFIQILKKKRRKSHTPALIEFIGFCHTCGGRTPTHA